MKLNHRYQVMKNCLLSELKILSRSEMDGRKGYETSSSECNAIKTRVKSINLFAVSFCVPAKKTVSAITVALSSFLH